MQRTNEETLERARIAHRMRAAGHDNSDIAAALGIKVKSVTNIFARHPEPPAPAAVTVYAAAADELDWTIDALCAQVDTELFYPEKGGSTRDAKRICGDCPVRRECLAYGLHDHHGIYGGLSDHERRQLAREGWTINDPLPGIKIPHLKNDITASCTAEGTAA